MVIANPIYDVVFKKMMENERVAKFFIGTLLEQNVETVEVKPQEFTYTDELAGLSVFRLDFIATIKMENGELRKILIEIQKAKKQIDLMRFRNYLAEQYKKKDKINDDTLVLPITTVYILGFKLPEIDTACIKVERNYRDLVNRKIIDMRSDFVEKLTHDRAADRSFIVQVERITDKYQTHLDKLLSVFEQTNFVDETHITKEYNHKTDLEELGILTDILHYTGTDPIEKKKIEIEQEAWRTVEAMTENVIKELNESKKALAEKDKELDEKDRLIEELRGKLNDK